MVLLSITPEQIRKIVEDANKTTEQKLNELTQKFENHVNKTDAFRRKLEVLISQIRDSHGDIADKIDELIRDWNDL